MCRQQDKLILTRARMIDQEWDQHHREVRHRLSWAPLLANGVLIVTVLSGALGSDDPSAMVRQTIAPLFLFGLGASVGFLAEELALKGDIEWKYGTAWWENENGPAKRLMPLPAKINALAEKSRTAEEDLELYRLLDEGSTLSAEAMRDGPAATDRVKKSLRLTKAAFWCRCGSLAHCSVGFIALLLTI